MGETLQRGNTPSTCLGPVKESTSSSDMGSSSTSFPLVHSLAEPEGRRPGLMRLLGPQRLRMIPDPLISCRELGWANAQDADHFVKALAATKEGQGCLKADLHVCSPCGNGSLCLGSALGRGSWVFPAHINDTCYTGNREAHCELRGSVSENRDVSKDYIKSVFISFSF